jgi:hypothetical protein
VKTTVVLVEGTFGGTWAADPISPFRVDLRRHGFTALHFQGWTTNVDGVPIDLWQRGRHRDWVAGGYALSYFLERLPYEHRNVICHSHGIAPVLYALALRGDLVPMRRLVSVCSPVRRDLQDVADDARPYVDRWRHVSSSQGDPWQRLGELFDGHVGWGARKWEQAHENVSIPGIGHSKLLNDPAFLDLWATDGMYDFLRAAGVTTGAAHV